MSFVGTGVATSSAWYKAEIARLQARIQQLEASNARLRAAREDNLESSPSTDCSFFRNVSEQ